MQERLKQDDRNNDDMSPDSSSSEDVAPAPPIKPDEAMNIQDNATDATTPVSEQQDATNDGAPKGSLKTKFYGVKKPGNDVKPKRKRNYSCPQCPQSYPNQSLLNMHYKAEHPPVTCPKCNLSFNMPSTLARHMYIHRELKFICAECKKGFPFEKDHERHMIHHKKIKSHFCVKPGCGKGFFNAHDLKKHAKIHDKKTWSCLQCQYTSPDEQNLKAHMRVHSDLKLYLCLKCLTLFKYHMQLVRHQNNLDMCCYDKEKYGSKKRDPGKEDDTKRHTKIKKSGILISQCRE